MTQVGSKEAARSICFEAENPELMPFLRKMAGEDAFERVCRDISAVNFI